MESDDLNAHYKSASEACRTKGMSEFGAQCILTKPHWYIKWHHQSNRSRNAQETSDSVMSPKRLPKAIFRFVDLSEVNIALREKEPKFLHHHFLQPKPTIHRVCHILGKVRLGELEPMYRIMTTTAWHQCITRSVHNEDSKMTISTLTPPP